MASQPLTLSSHAVAPPLSDRSAHERPSTRQTVSYLASPLDTQQRNLIGLGLDGYLAVPQISHSRYPSALQAGSFHASNGMQPHLSANSLSAPQTPGYGSGTEFMRYDNSPLPDAGLYGMWHS